MGELQYLTTTYVYHLICVMTTHPPARRPPARPDTRPSTHPPTYLPTHPPPTYLPTYVHTPLIGSERYPCSHSLIP